MIWYMSRKFLIITGVFSFLTLFVQWGLTGISGLFSAVIQIIVCGFIATIIGFLIRRETHGFRTHLLRSTLVFASVIGVFSSVIILFIAYQNLFPAAVWKVILTNNEKTVVFYQMSHIATPRFYSQVREGLIELTASWYMVYAEWVRPGTAENQERFDKLLGIKMTKTLYSNFSTLFGLVSQNDDLYEGIAPWNIQNVDISLDDIMGLIGTGTRIPEVSPVDIEAELAMLQWSEKWPLLAPFMRSVLNFLLKNEGSIDVFASGFPSEVFNTILHDRNEYIVATLESDSHKNIVLVYGALHFQGIYDLLRSHDSNWRILSVEALYPYSF